MHDYRRLRLKFVVAIVSHYLIVHGTQPSHLRTRFAKLSALLGRLRASVKPNNWCNLAQTEVPVTIGGLL